MHLQGFKPLLTPFPHIPLYTPYISSFDHEHQGSHYLEIISPILGLV